MATKYSPITQPPSSSQERKVKINPPLWRTPEFYFYYVMFVIVVPYMLKTTYDLSVESHPNYEKYKHKLQDGWIFNRKVDNSDAQYSNFRDNFHLLLLFASAYLVISHVARRFLLPAPSKIPQRPLYNAYLFLTLSLLAIYGIHGNSLLKILAILTINFGIGRVFKGSIANPVLTWIFNVGILFLNEMYDGYEFGWIDERLAVLDSFKGLLPRWQISFNITMLRLISYNMDYYWSFKISSKSFEKDDRNGAPLNERDRIEAPCYESDYNYLYYLAYILYIPLFIAGPILTFNNYISQLRYPSTEVTVKDTLIYALRFFGVLFVMELILHFFYVVAIKDTKAWEGDSPFELSMIGYFNLKIIWLKLLLPWRFFRLWAMADGIDAPENMLRCMSNNYSGLSFWRSWHRSYNRWVIRYIYIPMGGSKNALLNLVLVFTFVAFWHDISLRLLAWGWLISLFVLPEVIARKVFSEKKWGDWPHYRHLCALGAVFNILTMMIANLVGFCVGLEGMVEMLRGIFLSLNGLLFLFSSAACLFIAVQIMFEVREEEKRRTGKEVRY
ncbi:uncharacterized protein VTP21DRAFT_303 [Calcarisporiella thermophila]|uniref:uncharacterized protein n=1 Tax=Calcarisporiella thermophila TaxID=911321 RepID=UPI003742EBF8